MKNNPKSTTAWLRHSFKSFDTLATLDSPILIQELLLLKKYRLFTQNKILTQYQLSFDKQLLGANGMPRNYSVRFKINLYLTVKKYTRYKTNMAILSLPSTVGNCEAKKSRLSRLVNSCVKSRAELLHALYYVYSAGQTT